MAKKKAPSAGRVKAALTTDRPELELGNVTIPTEDLLSTGFTPLDVSISGRSKGGYGKGLVVLLVGDSEAGKTFLAYTCLAEAAKNPAFDDHKFVVDIPEGGAKMSIKRYFGSKVAERIEPPRGTRKKPEYSETIEDFYYNLDDCLNQGPCIYIEDSMDALDTSDDQEKFEERKKARREGKEVKGSYGMSKAKASSQGLRRVIQKIRKTGSILIMIAQAKDAVGFGFNPKTRAGGKSLKFYADVEMWMSVMKSIKKTVGGKDRNIGSIIGVKVDKNRLTGWKGVVEMPFYRSIGIDNVGGMVRYLTEEGHWPKKKGSITAPELGVTKKEEDLIRYIEVAEEEREVAKVCRKVWQSIERKCSVTRKPRYE
jgi:RecA/RadA recombinase